MSLPMDSSSGAAAHRRCRDEGQTRDGLFLRNSSLQQLSCGVGSRSLVWVESVFVAIWAQVIGQVVQDVKLYIMNVVKGHGKI